MTTSIQPVLDALSTWLRATNAYDCCERSLPAQPIARAAQELATAISAMTDAPIRRTSLSARDEHLAVRIVATMQAVTLRFVSDEYSDDDTDAPCDVEWDVHSLCRLVDPTHEIPEEIEPAHVIGTVFPHPSDDE